VIALPSGVRGSVPMQAAVMCNYRLVTGKL